MQLPKFQLYFQWTLDEWNDTPTHPFMTIPFTIAVWITMSRSYFKFILRIEL